jgi:hypothetical protein
VQENERDVASWEVARSCRLDEPASPRKCASNVDPSTRDSQSARLVSTAETSTIAEAMGCDLPVVSRVPGHCWKFINLTVPSRAPAPRFTCSYCSKQQLCMTPPDASQVDWQAQRRHQILGVSLSHIAFHSTQKSSFLSQSSPPLVTKTPVMEPQRPLLLESIFSELSTPSTTPAGTPGDKRCGAVLHGLSNRC